MSRLQVNTSFNIDLEFECSPFQYRLFAWLVDILVIYGFTQGMGYLLNRSFSLERAGSFGLTEIFLLFPVQTYHLWWELFFKGQSPGKRVFGIRVVSMNGQNASVSQCLLRWLLRFVDAGFFWGMIFLLMGNSLPGMLLITGSVVSFIMFIATPFHQRIGDMVAGTTVVLKRLPYELSDTLFQEIDLGNYRVHFPEVMRLSDRDLNLIDNMIKQHRRRAMPRPLHKVAVKIKHVLGIASDLPDDRFLETLLKDYNYLSRT